MTLKVTWEQWSSSSNKPETFQLLDEILSSFPEFLEYSTGPQTDHTAFHHFTNTLFLYGMTPEANTYQENAQIVFLLTQLLSHADIEESGDTVLRLFGLPTWMHLSKNQRQTQLSLSKSLRNQWSKIIDSFEQAHASAKQRPGFRLPIIVSIDTPMDNFTNSTTSPSLEEWILQSTLFPRLIDYFISTLARLNEDVLESKDDEEEFDVISSLNFIERFLELLISLLSTLTTRRFVRPMILSKHIPLICIKSDLAQFKGEIAGKSQSLHPSPTNHNLFISCLALLHYYLFFEVDERTGKALTENDIVNLHYDRVQQLQTLCYRDLPSLKEVAVSHVSSFNTNGDLDKLLKFAPHDSLVRLAEILDVIGTDEDKVDVDEESGKLALSSKVLIELIAEQFTRKPSQVALFKKMPLFPTERMLWDTNLLPPSTFHHEHVLALPKLSLQYLTLHDYLLRNYNLFRYESAHTIREDLEDAVESSSPVLNVEGVVEFTTQAPTALPIGGFNLTEVGPEKVGESCPSFVRSEIAIDIRSLDAATRAQWDSLKRHDVVYLLTVVPPQEQADTDSLTFRELFGVQAVRGAEVIGVEDEDGNVRYDDFSFVPRGSQVSERQGVLKGTGRTLRVFLDPNQYELDTRAVQPGGVSVYQTFNLVVRRNPKENNAKAVLDSIRTMIVDGVSVPAWLGDVLIGYGDPEQCIPANQPPLSRGEERAMLAERERIADELSGSQLDAVSSGLKHGLTLIDGAPGTGKTRVASHIISSLLTLHPNERVLVLAHSNSALNELFEAALSLAGQPRYFVRIGHGSETLKLNHRFSKEGRVDNMLLRRLRCLELVKALAESLGGPGEAVSQSCETAEYFFDYAVKKVWENFEQLWEERKENLDVAAEFPFNAFFEGAGKSLVDGVLEKEEAEAEEEAMQKDNDDDDTPQAEPTPEPLFLTPADAVASFAHAQFLFACVERLFEWVREGRPYELFTTTTDRTQHFVCRQAKVIAMTTTHASFAREDLVKQGFSFDSIVLEGAGSCLEIESFIPLVMQKNVDRLKRIVFIGDSRKERPTVQNAALRIGAGFGQSLFHRLLRLHVPFLPLTAQGLCKPSISRLLTRVYPNLTNTARVSQPPFTISNAGLGLDCQFVHVEGEGEVEQAAFFIENTEEARFAVELFKYLRLIGHPPHTISILTPFNGQRALIRDIVQKECAAHKDFGRPHKITTISRFEGCKDDIIILSLVRTTNPGRLSELAEIVGAVSSARHGLYVLGRTELVENTPALKRVLGPIIMKANPLVIEPTETFEGHERLTTQPADQQRIQFMKNSAQLAKINSVLMGAR